MERATEDALVLSGLIVGGVVAATLWIGARQHSIPRSDPRNVPVRLTKSPAQETVAAAQAVLHEGEDRPIPDAEAAISMSVAWLELTHEISPTRSVARLLTEEDFEAWIYDGQSITSSEKPIWVVGMEFEGETVGDMLIAVNPDQAQMPIEGMYLAWDAQMAGVVVVGVLGDPWHESMATLEALQSGSAVLDDS